MKYERITSRNEEPFYAFNACKECEQKDGCDKWCAYTVGAYTRLHELEDKIEKGELISTVQTKQSEQEMAFFVKPDVEVCKEVVKECLQVLRDTRVVPMCDDYARGWNKSIDVAIKRLAEKYRIDEEDRK